jgi:Uncharacterized protein predicted to be involved in DNA repair (RAMP superfamily)
MVIRFRIRLRAMSFLTVGGGVPDVMGSDIVHVRKTVVDGNGTRTVVYIPGSTVKGVLRTNASRVAAAYGFSTCNEVEPASISKNHEKMKEVCDVCKLFGRPGDEPHVSSKVYVSDFTSEVAGNNRILVTRVSLDDSTLTARRGALYTVEHVLPGTEYVGEVRVEESEGVKSLLPLLLLSIAELRLSVLGRGGLVDAILEDGGALDAQVSGDWRPLLENLRSWLWKGLLDRGAV